MGRVSTCQKNCKTIDLRGAQVNNQYHFTLQPLSTPAFRCEHMLAMISQAYI